MKKWFNKIKTNFKNATKGFSLVELIVVIAIMAVMAAVLAPALLGYVERSRAQKDNSAMDEVSNAITLSLADADVYDELLQCSVKDNYSCYADGDASTNTDDNKIITKSPDLWLFNDQCRLLDETAYQPAGKMRGVTVTFKPNGSAEYVLKDGIINKIGDDITAKGTNAGKLLSDASFDYLYNKLRSTVGDAIKVSSQTYRNSTYTIFISMGTTGGNQADKQDAIQVYGQYNGTNLPEVLTATGSATQDKGNAGSGSDSEKTEMIVGSATFNQRTENCYCEENGWQTHYCYVDIEPVTLTWDELKLTENGIKYGYIARNVNDSSVKTFTFRYCTALTNIVIPNSITSMETGVFEYCTTITNITIPNSITSISDSAFFQCYALKEITIPNSITSIGSGAFCECLNLKNIVFAGTMEEWNNITKGEGWNKTCPAIKVTCTNGTISIPANNFDSYS